MSEQHHHHHKHHRDSASIFREKTLRGIERRKLLEKLMMYGLIALAVIMAILVFLAYSIG